MNIEKVLEILEHQKQEILEDEDMMRNTSDYWRGQLIATVSAINAIQSNIKSEKND